MSTELKLKANDVVGVQEFGSAFAVSGDYTIVGACHDGFDPGAAWVEQAKLSASDTTGFDHFGAAVGMDDDYAIIGASQGGLGRVAKRTSSIATVRTGWKTPYSSPMARLTMRYLDNPFRSAGTVQL